MRQAKTPMADLFTPMANFRKTDPPTSREGAIATEESGQATQWRIRCLEAVTKWPGLTAGELAHRLGCERAITSKRLPELRDRDKPLVRNGTARKCNITRRKAMEWWPL